MKTRIAPVDGLRAVAVLGVLWAHIWAFCGTPPLSVGHLGPLDLDLSRLLSMLGTGVDLFFVISGFCMYSMYARKQHRFEWTTYVAFIKKRWLRIAPAFYAAILFYSCTVVAQGKPFPLRDALSHATFTGTWFTNAGNIYAPFWSLATEWHFYLFLPLFVASVARFGFRRAVVVSGGFSLLCCLFYYYRVIQLPLGEVAQANITYQIPLRLIEFIWGICVARCFGRQILPPALLRGSKGFVAGFTLAFVGRTFSVTEVLSHAHGLGPLIHSLSLPLLSLGYALALWSVVSSPSVWSKILCWSPIQLVGRWSYSLNLWHGAVYVAVGDLLLMRSAGHAWAPYLLFGISLLLLIPISFLSYTLLEMPYFLSQKRVSIAATEAAPGAVGANISSSSL